MNRCGSERKKDVGQTHREENKCEGREGENASSPLCADVLLFYGCAGHGTQADACPDVLELQAQVLSDDGEPRAALFGARLWKHLTSRGGAVKVGKGLHPDSPSSVKAL